MELINLNIIERTLPKKDRQLVREWAEIHQDKQTDRNVGHAKFPHDCTTGIANETG